jgi:hypothetical protein
LLTKKTLLKAIESEDYGFYPYSSEDTFEMLRSETTRYSIVRVPVEFVKSFEAFAAHCYLRTFNRPTEKDVEYIDVTCSDHSAITTHLQWLDSTEEPVSLKFKDLALRGIDTFDEIARIQGKDRCTDLVIAKNNEFYVSFLWFTTG